MWSPANMMHPNTNLPACGLLLTRCTLIQTYLHMVSCQHNACRLSCQRQGNQNLDLQGLGRLIDEDVCEVIYNRQVKTKFYLATHSNIYQQMLLTVEKCVYVVATDSTIVLTDAERRWKMCLCTSNTLNTFNCCCKQWDKSYIGIKDKL